MNNELILNMPVELTKSNARANAEQIIARVADGFVAESCGVEPLSYGRW